MAFFIYYNNLKQSDIYRLNQIQYRAGKLVTRALHFKSSSMLFLELGWEELSSRYNRFPLSSVQFSKSFFPFFSKLWSSLNKNIKCNTDFLKFKENLSFIYKPTKNCHFKYGTKIGNKC